MKWWRRWKWEVGVGGDGGSEKWSLWRRWKWEVEWCRSEEWCGIATEHSVTFTVIWAQASLRVLSLNCTARCTKLIKTRLIRQRMKQGKQSRIIWNIDIVFYITWSPFSLIVFILPYAGIVPGTKAQGKKTYMKNAFIVSPTYHRNGVGKVSKSLFPLSFVSGVTSDLHWPIMRNNCFRN